MSRIVGECDGVSVSIFVGVGLGMTVGLLVARTLWLSEAECVMVSVWNSKRDSDSRSVDDTVHELREIESVCVGSSEGLNEIDAESATDRVLVSGTEFVWVRDSVASSVSDDDFDLVGVGGGVIVDVRESDKTYVAVGCGDRDLVGGGVTVRDPDGVGGGVRESVMVIVNSRDGEGVGGGVREPVIEKEKTCEREYVAVPTDMVSSSDALNDVVGEPEEEAEKVCESVGTTVLVSVGNTVRVRVETGVSLLLTVAENVVETVKD